MSNYGQRAIYSGGAKPWVYAKRNRVAQACADFVCGMRHVALCEKSEKTVRQHVKDVVPPEMGEEDAERFADEMIASNTRSPFVVYKLGENDQRPTPSFTGKSSAWMRPPPPSRGYIKHLVNSLKRGVKDALTSNPRPSPSAADGSGELINCLIT